ncbi:MAG: N-6 DNA methylase [Pseudomonadota bacterium]
MSRKLQLDDGGKGVATPRATARKKRVTDTGSTDPVQLGRAMAKAWAASMDDAHRPQAAVAFVTALLHAVCDGRPKLQSQRYRLRTPQDLDNFYALDANAEALIGPLAEALAPLPLVDAAYQISAIYMSLLPNKLRSRLGIYYTPPALTERLLTLCEESGVDWRTARVLDPACGGGAFLMPVAMRMIEALDACDPRLAAQSIVSRLRGFEVDPVAAWLSQSFVEIALIEAFGRRRGPLPNVVTQCDALDQVPGAEEPFDLVIGNPPYGRLKLSEQQRKRYARSLYGHANLYGVFTDLALRWTRPNGLVAYVTPTSFLAGQYFKALRTLLAEEAPPVAIDIVEARKGVFEDVLQETMLAIYRANGKRARTSVHCVHLPDRTGIAVKSAGSFALPRQVEAPWVVPRSVDDQHLIDRLTRIRTRLADWGYKVSTGPLVWNRHKPQLSLINCENSRPLIWAEAVPAPGRFEFRAEKANHQPYFTLQDGDDWLIVDDPCVLVQRTTSKEQARRLIAAVLPKTFIKKHRAVIVENHLNMVRPIKGAKPKISLSAVSAVLNSTIADQAFRCISGSVAVSAFELEALPLPSVTNMRTIERMITRRDAPGKIDTAIKQLYLDGAAA